MSANERSRLKFPLKLDRVAGTTAATPRSLLRPQRDVAAAHADARRREPPSGLGLDSAGVRRRMAERLARHLSERLGDDAVAAHHGSLSKETRLDAEARLKQGSLRAIVATASLELGIDIGHVDLVCQIGSPQRIATLLQRVGRSGHTIGGTPKGRLFVTTQDDLVECVALLRAVRRGELDAIVPHDRSLDVLAQQIVAECACREYGEDELFEVVRRAWPYRALTRQEFDAVLTMVSSCTTESRASAIRTSSSATRLISNCRKL